jgi:hypothetical protein
MGLFTSNSTLASVIASLISFINLVIGVFSALALVIFFWGLVKYIYHSDDAKSREEGRSSIMWGLIALFVLFSIFGILQILDIAFFGGAPLNSGPTNYNAPTGQYNTSGPPAQGGIYPI